MKLVFVSFYTPRHDRHGASQSLACMRLAAAAISVNSNVPIKLLNYSIFDSFEVISNDILTYNPTFIGISIYNWSKEISQNVISLIIEKGYCGDIFIGGNHTPLIDVTNGNNNIIYVIGEGEQIIINYMAGKLTNQLKKTTIIINNRPNRIKCGVPLFSSPFFSSIGGCSEVSLRVLLWETSRGCNYRCGFCGHRIRDSVTLFPWKIIESEAKSIVNLSPHTLFIVDPSMGGNSIRLVKILSLFEHNNKIELTGYLRPELINNDVIHSLSKSHIGEILVGIQTLNTKVPRWIRENDYRHIYTHLPKLSQLNIPWRAELIVGLPGDDLDGLMKSIKDVIDEFKPRWLRIYPLLLIPGTPLFQQMQLKSSEHWINTDSDGLASESYSYSKEEFIRMKIFSGAISSLYCYLLDMNRPIHSYNYLKQIIDNEVAQLNYNGLMPFINLNKDKMRDFWSVRLKD